MKIIIYTFLGLFVLTSCSKDLSRETVVGPPETDTTVIHDTVIGTLKDTVWLTGLDLGIGDSLKANTFGISVTDTTEANPTLDWDTHLELVAPKDGIVICEYLSEDLWDNRTEDKTYLDRLRDYRDHMIGLGWKVWVIYPKPRKVADYTPSGYSEQEYADRINALTDSLKTEPEWTTVEGTYKAILAKLLTK